MPSSLTLNGTGAVNIRSVKTTDGELCQSSDSRGR